MPDELNQTTSTAEGSAPVVNTGEEQKTESATDYLNRSLAEIEQKTQAEPPPETELEIPGEKTGKKPEETEEIDESELLKRTGLTQKSLEDVKRDLDNSRTQAEFWNWANANIDGFSDFVFQKIMESRGLQPKGGAQTLADLGVKSEQKPAEPSKLLERFSQEQIDDFRTIATELGFVHKEQLAAEKQTEARENAAKEARTALNDFGKSEAVREQLKGLGLEWDKEVKGQVARILSEDFGITDFGKVTPKNIARAYNTLILERQGGVEQLLTNAKTEATKTHEEKLKLGQTVPKEGTRGPTAPPKDIQSWLNDPNTKADDIKKRMEQVARRR